MFHLYGLILGISFLIGFSYFQKHTNLNKKFHDHLFYGLVIFGIVFARLYHVLDQWDYYSQNPFNILKLWNGGLGIYGGFVGCFLFLIYFSQKHKLNLLNLLDQIAPSIPLIQSIGRWGNYVNQEVYGPNGQPVWFYESVLCFVLFLIIHKTKNNSLATYLLGYGLIRFFLEYLRNDTWQIGNLKVAQLISIILALLGLLIFKNNLLLTRPSIKIDNAKNRSG